MASFTDILNSPKPVLIDFFAEWCGPCKMMPPVLKELKHELGDKAIILKIDIDKNEAAARRFNVQAVPTLIIFKNGKEVWRQSGAMPVQPLLKVLNDFV